MNGDTTPEQIARRDAHATQTTTVLQSRRELPVSSENPIHRIVRFGVFEVDLEQRELRRSGAQRGATN